MRTVLQGTVSELHEMCSPVNRAGVIPYAVHNNEIYWLFGVGSDGKLHDFGGGRKRSKDETPIKGLLREVHEESSGVLTGNITEAIAAGEHLSLWKAEKDSRVTDYLLLAPIPYWSYGLVFYANSEIRQLKWILQSTVLSLDINDFADPLRRYIRKFQVH